MIRTLVASSFLTATSAFAIDLHVNPSGPFPTIQSAIFAAAAGDRVLVEDLGPFGVYNLSLIHI